MKEKLNTKMLHTVLILILLFSHIPFYIPNIHASGEFTVPDAITTQTNLTGTVTDIQDNPSSPDTKWLTVMNTSNATVVNGTFANPSQELKVGSGLQTVQFLLRKNAASGNTPTTTVKVIENNNGTKTTIATQSVFLTDSPILQTVSFNASALTNKTGANVEWEVTSTPASGSGTSKRSVEVGAIRFLAEWKTAPFGAPPNFHLTENTQNSNSLEWEPVLNAVSYEVLRDGISVYNGTNVIFTDTGLTKNTTYTYEVKAFNGSETSSPSVLVAKTLGNGWWKISSGNNHSLGIKSDGTLWSWGDNSNGQLGHGDIVQRNSPTQIGTATNWKSIQAGTNRSLAIKADGTLWSWGNNTYGQLGHGDIVQRNSPTQIGTATNWKSITGRYNHSLAIKTDGTLWSWGYNINAQLGLGDTTNRNSPTQIGTDTTWKLAEGGLDHSLAIKTDGTLWSWGLNEHGQLGHGNYSSTNMPTQIGTAVNWRSLSAGETTSFAIKTGGTLWAWGENNVGMSGTGDNSSALPTPTQVGTESDWKSISAGSSHSLAIKTEGTLWSWGQTTYGKLGLGDVTGSQLTPVRVGTETNWGNVQAGNQHSLAIKTDETIWSWGYNNFGQLGHGDTSVRNIPTKLKEFGTPENFLSTEQTQTTISLEWNQVFDATSYEVFRNGISVYQGSTTSFTDTGLTQNTNYTYEVTAFNGSKTSNPASLTVSTVGNGWMKISSKNHHSLAIKTDGTLWSWGSNSDGQLGLGDTTDRLRPIQVGTDTNWKSIKTGVYHSLALKTDGTLWSWGGNSNGQLGFGDTTNRLSPTQVGTGTNWRTIGSGSNHSIAIKTDGTLWIWGQNSTGQLGLGDTTDRLSPTQVGTGTNWKMVESGANHSIAMKTDGTLWSWGWNYAGQLGLGDTTDRLSPTQVGTDISWKMIASGDSHSMAIKTDGTLWSWGDNYDGQLGFVDSSSRYIPTRVGTETNWNIISAGNYHSFAIKTNGTLWSWGYNSNGQLGLGDTTKRTTPTQVGTGTNWKITSGGNRYTLALKTDGILWSWGYNMYGQLGHGDTTDRHIPTQIGKVNEVTNLTETHTDSSITLNWTAASGSNLTYDVYLNGTLHGTGITGTSYTISGLAGSTTYSLKVVTRDNQGNSSDGATINATTDAATATGSLSITSPLNTDFGDETVSSSVQTLSASLATLTVSDTRSSNDGWHVSVSASPFTQINGSASKTLPANSLSLAGIQNITQTSGTSILPQSLLSGSSVIDNGAINVLQANAGEGIGTFEISFPSNALSLSVDTRNSVVDSSVAITEYESTLIWVISAGP